MGTRSKATHRCFGEYLRECNRKDRLYISESDYRPPISFGLYRTISFIESRKGSVPCASIDYPAIDRNGSTCAVKPYKYPGSPAMIERDGPARDREPRGAPAAPAGRGPGAERDRRTAPRTRFAPRTVHRRTASVPGRARRRREQEARPGAGARARKKILTFMVKFTQRGRGGPADGTRRLPRAVAPLPARRAGAPPPAALSLESGYEDRVQIQI